MKISIIFFKELKDAFRDKRTIIMTMIIPTLLIPLLLFSQFYFQNIEIKRTKDKVIKVSYSGPFEFEEFLRLDQKIELIKPYRDIGKSIEEKNIDAAIEIINGKAIIYYDPTIASSSFASQKLKTLLFIYSEKVVELRLKNLGIDPNVIKVFNITEQSVATPSKMGAFFAAMIIPILILSIGISGNLYLFSDIGAGEKERGTLEPLLATPAKRSEIALGKWLAVSLLSFLSIMLMLIVMLITINFGQPLLIENGQESTFLQLNIISILVIMLSGLLLSLSGGAFQFTISIWARNIREAQLYLGYVPMVIILPTVILNILGIMGNLPYWSYYIPLINLYPIIYTAIMNELITSNIIVALITNGLLTLIGIYVISKILNKEEVILRI